MELNHQIFGKINYNYGWIQDITVTIFGKKSVLEMNIDADADGEFIFFKEHLDEIIKESNAAIVSYYNSEIADIVSGYTNIRAKQYFLDKIGDEEQIYSLLTPKQIMFPLTFDEHVEEFGFICDCDWDKENGVGIKFTNGILSEIGSQDILL